MEGSYRTVWRAQRHEPEPTKRSRFIADLRPVDSAAAALAEIEALRSEFPDASHHCWAYRLGARGDLYRFSDDGEPSGSAGRPIYQQLEAQELTNLVVVVTRYFGGTKLGVGGLVRAYGGAAAELLRTAKVREVVPTRRLVFTVAYASAPEIERLLADEGLGPVDAEYAAAVRLALDVPLDRLEALRDRITDLTAGQAVWEGDDPIPG